MMLNKFFKFINYSISTETLKLLQTLQIKTGYIIYK